MARIYRTTFACTGSNGRLIQPSLHYVTQVAIGGDEPPADDIAAGVWALLGTAFKAVTPSDVTIHGLVASEEVVKPEIGVAGFHSVEQAGSLASSGATIPDGLVPLINIHSGVRSRSARGWVHLPSPKWSNQLAGNGWDSAHVARLNTFAALLDDELSLGEILVTSVLPVVYSRTRHAAGTDPWWFQVTSATVNPVVKFLRPRMSVP